MIKKRYFVTGYSVWDSYNNNKRVDTRSKPICDLLNDLNDENEQLKSENQELMEYGRELLEYINSPPKHRKSIFDAVVCFKDRKVM